MFLTLFLSLLVTHVNNILFSSYWIFMLFFICLFYVYLSYGQLEFTGHKMSSNCRINLHIVKWLASYQILIKLNFLLSLR